MSREWNAALYESNHSFVWEYGRDLIGLLAPQPGERILDVGSGTGRLTADIAASGAEVLGMDSSPAMIDQAKANFPGLRFEKQDVTALPYRAEFDAVFSNAVLHWVHKAREAAAGMAAALKPGGRMVLEFGGRGNVRAMLDAVRAALRERLGSAPDDINPWYFPGIPDYGAVLESHGLELSYAALFDRPTALEGGEKGLANWLAMFGGPITPELNDPAFVALVEKHAAAALARGGSWSMDYRRLRVVARKP